MPLIHLQRSEGLSAEMADAIAERLTGITRDVLGKDPKVTVVRIDAPLHESRLYVDAATAGPTICTLSIQITAGSNTVEEKTSWLSEVASLLEIKQSDVPNYITIHEIPGADWGFNGLSQTSRKELPK
ncbi:hypothetical protein ABEB22_14375 (plasmid) [Thioclava sp. 'Guangxiensis']|uniref:hypothetical protein n=1 Tax=Thioclava sp. 'Guangxiensis' TaxID=3149044 RepID=UPI0032C46CFE